MGIIAAPRTRSPMMPLDEPRKEELLAALRIMGIPLDEERTARLEVGAAVCPVH